MTRIGLPQCWLWYEYYPLLTTFWQELGATTVSSGPTDRAVLEAGLAEALDELCCPMKLVHGHVRRLAELGADYIFLPRLISVEPRCFTCPNIMGLPDMIRSRMRDIPPLLCPRVDLRQGHARLKPALKTMGAVTGRHRPRQIQAAWDAARAEQQSFRRLLRAGYSPPEALAVWEGKSVAVPAEHDLTIGVVGHGYVLYDPWLSMGLVSALRGLGCRVVFMESLPPETIARAVAALPRRIFWSSGQKMTGAAMVMAADPAIDGVAVLSSMGCGPDAVLLNTIAAQLAATPGLFLSVDEHRAETALMTRLEAFCDLLRRKRRMAHEHNLSPYGLPAPGGARPDDRTAAGLYPSAAHHC